MSLSRAEKQAKIVALAALVAVEEDPNKFHALLVELNAALEDARRPAEMVEIPAGLGAQVNETVTLP